MRDTMTERDSLLFDHSLPEKKENLQENEVFGLTYDFDDSDRLETDVNFILQNIIDALQNIDERLQEVENQ